MSIKKKLHNNVDEVYIFSLWYYPSHFGIHIADIARAFISQGIKVTIVTVKENVYEDAYFDQVRHMFLTNNPIRNIPVTRVPLIQFISRDIFTPILIPGNIEALNLKLNNVTKRKNVIFFHIFEAFAPYFNKCTFPDTKACYIYFAGNYVTRTMRLLDYPRYKNDKVIQLIIDANMSNLYLPNGNLRGVDAVLSQTRSLAKMIENTKPNIQAHFVHRPINLGQIRKNRAINIRKKYSLESNSILLVYAGRPTKNVEVLLEILFKAHTKISRPVYLLIIGTQNFDISKWKYYNKVKDWLINIDFLDRQQLFNYFKDCDLLVYPGLIDGYPKVINECQYLGLPVLAFDSYSSGSREIIKDGVTGYIVPEGDVNAFVSKILKIIKNKKANNEIIDNAKRYIDNDFSDKKFVDEIKKITLQD